MKNEEVRIRQLRRSLCGLATIVVVLCTGVVLVVVTQVGTV